MKKIFLMLSMFLFPVMIFAESHDSGDGISGVLSKFEGLLNNLYSLIVAAIIVAFAWGVFKFIFKGGEEQEKGKGIMIWSVVAITILFSIWGIVQLFQETVGVDGDATGNAPGLPTIGS